MVPSKGDQRFPRTLHLRRPAEFRKNRRLGQRVRSAHFLVSVSPGPSRASRLGLVVGRKVGGAVQRNRTKRYLREVFRTARERFPAGRDVVVIALSGAASLPLSSVRDEVLGCLARIGPGTRP
jgi:ribonuclease P protein component